MEDLCFAGGDDTLRRAEEIGESLDGMSPSDTSECEGYFHYIPENLNAEELAGAWDSALLETSPEYLDALLDYEAAEDLVREELQGNCDSR